jgi:RNA ligase (TIGR02306 family)
MRKDLGMRKLAQIAVIHDIQPIPDADSIEVASVLGWKVVVRKNEYKVGDKVIYLEIDSWVPHSLAPFLSKGNAPREFRGVTGDRLKTLKLRGQVSQGLILPLSVLNVDNIINLEQGTDVTSILHIQKWEPELPAQLRGEVKAQFPAHLCNKTDEERVQSSPQLLEELKNKECYISVKCDGTSFTYVYHKDTNEDWVCSRNLALHQEDSNVYWNMCLKYNLQSIARTYCQDRGLEGIAIQSEIVGPGIQGNKMGLSEVQMLVFDIYDISTSRYFEYDQLMYFCKQHRLQTVPIQDSQFIFNHTIDQLLELADGKYDSGMIREGIVIRPLINTYSPTLRGRLSVKVINNKYLLKGGE